MKCDTLQYNTCDMMQYVHDIYYMTYKQAVDPPDHQVFSRHAAYDHQPQEEAGWEHQPCKHELYPGKKC